MNSWWAALRFLTVFPLPAAWGQGEDSLSKSPAWFPMVGLLLGGLAATLAWLLQTVAPAPLTASLLVFLLAGFSGGLHLDGLADTADGFLSSRPREQILEIMKDSRTGPLGAAAIMCILLLKFAAIFSLSKPVLIPTLFLMPLAGRCALVLHLALLPYVRSRGLGTIFSRISQRPAAVWSLVILLASGWLAAGLAGLAAAFASLVVALGLAWYSRNKIQGATGDTYGAACEITEAIPAVILACWPTGGM